MRRGRIVGGIVLLLATAAMSAPYAIAAGGSAVDQGYPCATMPPGAPGGTSGSGQCGATAPELPFWARRHLVKPGLTGWAQVRRGYTADAAGTGDKLSYDLWYLRHRSLVVDLAICAKTFSTLLSGSGAR
jgi:hypothetical protein